MSLPEGLAARVRSINWKRPAGVRIGHPRLVAVATGTAWVVLAWTLALGVVRLPAHSMSGWFTIAVPPALVLAVILATIAAPPDWRATIGGPIQGVGRKASGWIALTCVGAAIASLVTFLTINQFGFAHGLPILVLVAAFGAAVLLAGPRLEASLALLLLAMPVIEFLRGELQTSRGMSLSVLILPVVAGDLPPNWAPFVLMSPEVLLVSMIAASHALRARRRTHTPWWGVNRATTVAIMGLAGAGFCSAVRSPDRMLSLSYLVEALLVPAVLFFTVAGVRWGRHELQVLSLSSAGVLGLMGLYHLHRLYQRTGLDMAALGPEARYGATFYNPGTYSALIILLWPLALGVLLLEREARPVQAAVCAGLSIAAVDLVLGYSRAAWVAAALQLAIVFTVSRRARRWTAAGLAGALPLLLAGAGRRIGDIIWSIRPGQFLLGGAADPTLLTRIFIWQQSVQLLIKNPLTGIGLGMMPRQGIVYAGWYHVTNAHNLLLNLWVEGGTPAALALASLFGGVFWTAARAYRLADNLDNRRMMLTFVVSIAGYVLLSQAHSFLALDHGISQTLVVWMVLALVVAVARQPAEGEAPV